LAIVVDDPVPRAAPAPADIIIGRPDRPSSIVAPNQNLRTTIPLKRNGDVNQQPLRRPGGSSRSVAIAPPRILARVKRDEGGQRGRAYKGSRLEIRLFM
jgi:hypothetical protein